MFGGTCQVSVGKCHMLRLYNLTLSTYCSLAYPGKRKNYQWFMCVMKLLYCRDMGGLVAAISTEIYYP